MVRRAPRRKRARATTFKSGYKLEKILPSASSFPDRAAAKRTVSSDIGDRQFPRALWDVSLGKRPGRFSILDSTFHKGRSKASKRPLRDLTDFRRHSLAVRLSNRIAIFHRRKVRHAGRATACPMIHVGSRNFTTAVAMHRPL